jgi:apolipoprotein D and lipocalin family protein
MTLKLVGTVLLMATALLGCTGVPKGLEPVSGFDGERYLGRWYEIARLDHSFERGLSNVSAMYTAKENGEISVLNRGYNEKSGNWKQIEGKARFIDDESIGSLKVSFFGPFYGGYHVIELDRVYYSYAMVSGPSFSYLWILSRTTELDDAIYSRLVNRAAELGFDTTKLIRVKHDRTAKIILPAGETKMSSKSADILPPCPDSPNCVSSLAETKKHFIAPIPYNGETAVARYELLGILHSFKRARLATIEENYIHAEFVSSIFRFVDDVEFYFDTDKKLIQMRSASRIGYSDLGVNRRRIEAIRKQFDQKAIQNRYNINEILNEEKHMSKRVTQ